MKDVTTDEIMRDCILMHPGSTVEDLYIVMKHTGLLAGDYVRAETRDPLGKHKTLQKATKHQNSVAKCDTYLDSNQKTKKEP